MKTINNLDEIAWDIASWWVGKSACSWTFKTKESAKKCVELMNSWLEEDSKPVRLDDSGLTTIPIYIEDPNKWDTLKRS